MISSRSTALPKRGAATLRRINTPLLPCVVAFFVASLFTWIQLRHVNFDPRWFIGAGKGWADGRVLGKGFPIAKNDVGFDGQFYYRLAINPFTSTRTAHGITLDAPSYRQQRIFYPFLAWVFSLGQKAMVPWSLIAVNVLAFCVIGYMGGWWAKALGCHAFWGVLLLFHLGYIFSFLNTLTEIVEIACLLVALAFLHRKHWMAAGIAFSLAILSKETALPFAFTAAVFVLGQAIWHREKPERATLWLLLPLAVYASVQIILTAVWGQLPAAANTGNLHYPFEVLVPSLLALLRSAETFLDIVALEMWLCALFIIAACFRLPKSAVSLSVKVGWVLCVVLFVSLSSVFFDRDIHFTRAFSETYIIGLLFFLAASLRVRSLLLIVSVSACLFRSSIPYIR